MISKAENKNSSRKITIAVCVLAVLVVGIFVATSMTGMKGKTCEVVYGEDIAIETPYCTLHYPIEWKDDVNITCRTTDDAYYVDFTGKVGGKKMKFLTIAFGNSTEMPLGVVTQEDGSEVIVMMDIELEEFGGSWSQEDIDKIYEMQSGSNYLLEALAEMENFQ